MGVGDRQVIAEASRGPGVGHLPVTRLLWRVCICLLCVRVPKRPVINTPVVSISVHDDEELLPRALDKPVTVQFRLLETEERTKPICVFWNHSIL